ncbi:la protein homolog [Halyomorpha halys]|uniref:la protein homolog n=1 Tax=Halyomorpha halys TaxID=286706 RepID=UPI0006D4CAC0|nr:la protein homolog [Halyomorpha halys]
MVEAEEVGAEKSPNNEESVSDLEKKIIRQVEYYFGDINLAKDKFLQEQIKLDDGWVPMEIMLKFNRLSQLSPDPDVITKALLKSSSKLMEVSEDNSKIRRSPNMPLPEMNEGRRKELMSRTVYCKGFPTEDTTIHKLLDFFPQFGDIDNVIMRSFNDKATKTWKFKGSVFVIFATVEGAQNFLSLDSVKYNDTELIKKWQSVYLDDKRKEKLEAKGKNKKKKANKEGKEEDAESKNEDGNDDNKNDEEDGNKEEKREFPRGSVVQLKGLGEKNELRRDDLKAAVEKLGVGVGFVEFTTGQDEAWLRLDAEGSALELAGLVKGGVLEINSEVKADLRVIEGDEEETFLTKCLADKKKLVGRSRNKARRGRPFNNHRKRKGSPSKDGSKKVQKTN